MVCILYEGEMLPTGYDAIERCRCDVRHEGLEGVRCICRE